MFTAADAARISEGGASLNYYTYNPALYPAIVGASADTPNSESSTETDNTPGPSLPTDTPPTPPPTPSPSPSPSPSPAPECEHCGDSGCDGTCVGDDDDDDIIEP